MAPGVRCTIETLPDFEENQPVAIAFPSGVAVAVGTFLVSSKEAKRNQLKGRLVHIEHILGDYLFTLALVTLLFLKEKKLINWF